MGFVCTFVGGEVRGELAIINIFCHIPGPDIVEGIDSDSSSDGLIKQENVFD